MRSAEGKMKSDSDWEFNYLILDRSTDTGYCIAAYNQKQAIERCVIFQKLKKSNLEIVKKWKNDREGILEVVAEMSQQSDNASTVNLPHPALKKGEL